MIKRYKEIEVDRQEIDTNIGGYTKKDIKKTGLKDIVVNSDWQRARKR